MYDAAAGTGGFDASDDGILIFRRGRRSNNGRQPIAMAGLTREYEQPGWDAAPHKNAAAFSGGRRVAFFEGAIFNSDASFATSIAT